MVMATADARRRADGIRGETATGMEGQLNTPGDERPPVGPCRCAGCGWSRRPANPPRRPGGCWPISAPTSSSSSRPRAVSPPRELPPVSTGRASRSPSATPTSGPPSLDLASPSGQQRWSSCSAAPMCGSTAPRPASVPARRSIGERLWRTLPGLVIVSITPFGQTGPVPRPRRDHPVLFALSGLLALSRLPDRPPLLPPGRMAYDIGAAMAAYLALVAVWRRLESGAGGYVEMPVHAAMVQAADAILPVADVVTRAGTRTYPVYRCRDGVVRLVLLTPRHSDGDVAWLARRGRRTGRRRDRARPRLDAPKHRSRFFGPSDRRRGGRGGPAPWHPVGSDHARRQTSWRCENRPHGRRVRRPEVLPGRRAWVPAGYFEVDDHRAGSASARPGWASTRWSALIERRAPPDEPLDARRSRHERSAAARAFWCWTSGSCTPRPETGKLLADSRCRRHQGRDPDESGPDPAGRR